MLGAIIDKEYRQIDRIGANVKINFVGYLILGTNYISSLVFNRLSLRFRLSFLVGDFPVVNSCLD